MFDLGDIVPLTVQVRDQVGALTAPATAVWTITLPDGTSIAPAMSNPSIGVYAADYQPPAPGRYTARFVSTGPSTAYVDEFDVASATSLGIISLSAAKAALNLDYSDSSNDEELRQLIEAVTAAVENYRGEVIVRRTVADYVSGRRATTRRRLVLSKRPVLSLTSVTRPYDGYAWDPTQAVLVDPEAGIIVSYGTPFYGDMVITYLAGYSAVPANYIEGAKIILKHLWQVQQTPGMGPSPFTGGDVSPSPGAGYAIPNRAAQLLGGRAPLVG